MTSRLQFCSFASREYLPFARVLAQGIRRYHPDADLFVLLVDDLAREVDATKEPFHCVRNEEIGLDPAELHRMYVIHGHMFLAAIKPFFIDHIVRSSGAPTLFVDTDIGVYGSLADLGELIDEHGTLLFPHARSPYPLDGCMPDDTTILSAGTFNDGMIGFGERGLPALDFLKARLRRECVADPQQMRVCGQRWLDYAPSFFNCHVSRDPGLDAAYWNLHERPLTMVDGAVFAGGVPLRAYHFSGYEPANPGVLSKHCAVRPRITLADQPILATLCREFLGALGAAGLERHRGIPLPFNTLPGGIPLDDILRTIYRDAVITAEATGSELPPDGYDLAERDAFVAWARASYPTRGVAVPAWAAPAVVNIEELVRTLARTSSDALSNLNQRLSDLESLVARLASVGADSR